MAKQKKAKLDVASVSDTVRRYNLKTERDLLEHGYTLKYLGGGLFRNAYRIVGTKLVVKVPLGIKGKRHTEGEMRAYRKIMRPLKKYDGIRLYMPEILEYNARTGIVLMTEYRKASGRDWKKIKEIAKIAGDAMGKYCDLHKWNIGKGKLGDFRVIDLGYFMRRIKPKPRKVVLNGAPMSNLMARMLKKRQPAFVDETGT